MRHRRGRDQRSWRNCDKGERNCSTAINFWRARPAKEVKIPAPPREPKPTAATTPATSSASSCELQRRRASTSWAATPTTRAVGTKASKVRIRQTRDSGGRQGQAEQRGAPGEESSNSTAALSAIARHCRRQQLRHERSGDGATGRFSNEVEARPAAQCEDNDEGRIEIGSGNHRRNHGPCFSSRVLIRRGDRVILERENFPSLFYLYC